MKVRKEELSLTDTETPVSPNYSLDIVIIVYILLIFGSKKDFNFFFTELNIYLYMFI